MRSLMISPSRNVFPFEKIFDNFFSNSPFFGDAGNICNVAEGTESGFSPKVNITEADNQVKLNFELPGIDKDKIKVTVKNGQLTVSGERNVEQKTETEDFVRSEIFSGQFSRSFTLPKNVRADKIKADYKNGMLLISLPKTEESKPKEIDVSIN
ncbi:MAG: Hsp20/alpha crystallin family protein [candidate division Zixibacteria bacterium]